MKLNFWLSGLICATFLGCAPDRTQSEIMSVASHSAERGQDTVYVDVRTPDEFASGHVKGAMHIPYDEMESRWRELEAYKDKDIVLYCRSGRRSGIAESVLKEKGFRNVRNAGGLEDLQKAGVPVTE